uniref:Trichohyalin-like n=1 Tax=Crassostrea virginica TaxID=6565 RepID=A0A8B8CLE5_CRAVI|nr:trichohyalin-like [Crassostrea virginica]
MKNILKQQLEDDKRNKLAEQRRQAPAPIVKGDYYDSEQYDRRRQALNDLQHKEYQNYLKNVDPHKTRTQQGYGTSLPMVESELRYNEFRKIQEAQRNKDYNVLLKHEQHRNRVPTPDTLQGLPLSQRQYDNMRKMQEKQRNQEYNQLLAKKGFNQHQPPDTNRRPELGMKSEFQDQEPAGRQSQRNYPVGSLIAGDRVDYPSSANEKFNKERRKEYNEYIKPQDLKNIHRKREEAIAKIESDGIDLDKVRIFPQGEYEQKHKELQEEWRKNFRDFAAKKHDVVKKDLEEREKELARYYQKEIDNPAILPAGEYKERQKKLQKQWRDECRDYYSGKQDTDRFRRQENGRSENRIGFMSQLGRPVEEMREKLAKERHEEYNKYLQDKYVSQSQHRPLERPKWVDPKLMEDNWQKEAAGSRSRPSSDKPVQTPTYERCWRGRGKRRPPTAALTTRVLQIRGREEIRLRFFVLYRAVRTLPFVHT